MVPDQAGAGRFWGNSGCLWGVERVRAHQRAYRDLCFLVRVHPALRGDARLFGDLLHHAHARRQPERVPDQVGDGRLWVPNLSRGRGTFGPRLGWGRVGLGLVGLLRRFRVVAPTGFEPVLPA